MVIVKLTINKRKYNSLSDTALVNFTGTVLENGYQNPDYQDLAIPIKALLDESILFAKAVDRSRTDGGKDRTKATKNARKVILLKHDAVADELETLAVAQPNPEAYINYLGYDLFVQPARKTGTVPPPILKSWKSGGKDALRGVVSFVIKAADAKEINAVIGKYSLDGGITWGPEFVSTKLVFSLDNQPSGKNVIYQFKFLATNNRESFWSMFYDVGVY